MSCSDIDRDGYCKGAKRQATRGKCFLGEDGFANFLLAFGKKLFSINEWFNNTTMIHDNNEFVLLFSKYYFLALLKITILFSCCPAPNKHYSNRFCFGIGFLELCHSVCVSFFCYWMEDTILGYIHTTKE